MDSFTTQLIGPKRTKLLKGMIQLTLTGPGQNLMKHAHKSSSITLKYVNKARPKHGLPLPSAPPFVRGTARRNEREKGRRGLTFVDAAYCYGSSSSASRSSAQG